MFVVPSFWYIGEAIADIFNRFNISSLYQRRYKVQKIISKLREKIKTCFASVGIKSPKDILFSAVIWLTGPIMLFLAFGQSVQQPQKSLVNLTFLTYTVGIIATVFCVISTFYGVWGLFLKEKSFQGHTFKGKFSILIGARNEEKVITKLLEDIQKQTYTNFEAIVVCHNCSDDTYNVASQIKDKRIIPLELKGAPLGKSVALNYGVKHATGEIIVVFDADNSIPEDFLEKLAAYFPYYDGVQTKIETKNPSFNLLTRLQDLEFFVFTDIYQKTRQALRLNALFGGTGEAVKKEVLEKVGNYDEWAFSEDFALCTKLTIHGYRLGWCVNTYVLDEKTPWWSDFFRQRARWTKGHLQVIVRYAKNYWNRPADLHYLIAPMIVLAPFFTMLLWVGFFLKLPLSASFVPLWVWATPWIIWNLSIAIRIYNKKGLKSLLFFPLLFLYYYHWLSVLGYIWKVKAWPKTPHGFEKEAGI
ncbi:MAG: glycosyltransferase family 2 protein [Candidatus Parcubacteria bacterium]|nr:glycosyltransferase family 2 protein [Candidatus Parcubacteria bacterium]